MIFSLFKFSYTMQIFFKEIGQFTVELKENEKTWIDYSRLHLNLSKSRADN